MLKVKASVQSKKLAFAALLGVAAFVSKGFLPTPVDKMFVVIEALTFAVASLLLGRLGATYASLINGALLSILRPGFFPFSLIFSVIYGLLIDGSFHVFRVKTDNYVKNFRLISSLTLSTAITGLMSVYITTLFGLMAQALPLYVIILVIGIINGLLAGFLTALIWNRYLIYHVKTVHKMT